MNNTLKQIGIRIKTIREIAGLSIEEFAASLNLDAQVYKKYEEGSTDIPVSVLYEISKNHNVELTAILTGEEPKLQKYFVVKKGTGLDITRRKEYSYQDLAYNFAHKKSEIFLVTIPPEVKHDSSGYAHAGQEFNYVLEGTLKINFENGEVVLEAGDSIYFNSNNVHKMYAVGNKPAKFLAVIII
jgi:mannose-6-phosphate isomerase-like protein (cupin superfamily)